MSDVVVTVPKVRWEYWIAEGDLPSDEWDRKAAYLFSLAGSRPNIAVGERVYVVAHGKLRGYAPLITIQQLEGNHFALVRGGGAVAVTINEPIRGFMGWRYRWWDRGQDVPFPNWREP